MPITSDPGVLLNTGFVPLGAIDPNTGAPAVTQPALPGEAGVAQPSTPVAGEPVPGGSGSGGTSSGTPAKPAPSPGHAGGTAANTAQNAPGGAKEPPVRPKPQPSTPRAPAEPGSSKAVAAELDALRRHLNKGRDIATWDARYLTSAIMTLITESLGRGVEIDKAISLARSRCSSDSSEKEGEREYAKSSHPAWPGWAVDQQLTQEFSLAIRNSVSSVFAPIAREIAEQWLTIAVPGKNAEHWLQVTYPQLAGQLFTVLSSTLRAVWRRGWALGEHSARVMVQQQSAKSHSGDDSSSVSSSSVIDEQALREWLNTAGISTITGISDTRIGDLAQALDAAVNEGQSPDQLADVIAALGSDEVNADLVSGTELARAVSQASLNTYDEFGVTQVSWLIAPTDACPLCVNNSYAGDIPIGSAFPDGSTAPPAHPRCRCVLQPAEISGIDIGSIASSVASMT